MRDSPAARGQWDSKKIQRPSRVAFGSATGPKLPITPVPLTTPLPITLMSTWVSTVLLYVPMGSFQVTGIENLSTVSCMPMVI